MEIRLTLQEAKRRLESYEKFYSTLNIKEEGFYQVSQYGFSDENNNVIYPDSNSIATHLILSRYVMNVNNISRAIYVERIKNDLNPFHELETYHVRNARDLIVNGIISLSEAGIIKLYFIKDEGKEFCGTTKELKTRLRDKSDPFKFTQTLKEVNDGRAMYFRLYDEHFETLVSEAFAEDAREAVGNTQKGISIKFDALAVYGAIASRLNAINKETMFTLEEFENYNNSDIFKSDYKFYGSSVNYSSQQTLAKRTSNDKAKPNSSIGVDRMNTLELLMTKKYNIFVHVKVARINRPPFQWNIYRAFAYDRKALYKFVYMEIQKSLMEFKAGKLSENAVVNILEHKYLYTKKSELEKDLEFNNSLNENIKESSVDTEDEVEVKVDHKIGFGNIEEENVFDRLERLEAEEKLKEDKKILPLGQTEEEDKNKENKLTFISNYNTKKPECKQLNAKEWHKISDANKQYLILQETIKRHKTNGIPYLDAFDVENAYNNENHSMINQIFNGNIKYQIITNEDFEQAIKNNPNKNLGYFKAERVVETHFDQNPYEIDNEKTDELINDVLSYFKVK